MTVERDIAGFALLFLTGIYVSSLINFPESPVFMSFMIIAAAILMACIYFSHCRNKPEAIVPLTVILVFISGVICFRTAEIAAISSLDTKNLPGQLAGAMCAKVRAAIDSMPFENPHTGAMVKALLTGDRTSLTQEITDIFRGSGAAHILALSGLHLGIIYGMISRITAFSGNSPQAKAVRATLNITSCGFYTLATGAGESIVRAFLFIFLNETARLTGREKRLRVILPSALIIQLATDPLAIRSVSFQMSYSAMAGIAYIHPLLEGFWPGTDGRKATFREPFRKIWSMVSMTVSCQLTTAPIAWHFFRTFPHNFLMSNLLALPISGIFIPASFTTTALFMMGICPEFMIRITEYLSNLLIFCLRITASM